MIWVTCVSVCIHAACFSTYWILYVLSICGLLFITSLYLCVCFYDLADVIQLHADSCAHTQTPGWAQMKTSSSLLNINKRKTLRLCNSLINHSSIMYWRSSLKKLVFVFNAWFIVRQLLAQQLQLIMSNELRHFSAHKFNMYNTWHRALQEFYTDTRGIVCSQHRLETDLKGQYVAMVTAVWVLLTLIQSICALLHQLTQGRL